MKNYFIYILTNKNNTVLYTLVYYEKFNNPMTGINRVKLINAGSRKKEIDLINKFNEEWKDLYSNTNLYL